MPNGIVPIIPFSYNLYQGCCLDLICTTDHWTIIYRLEPRWKIYHFIFPATSCFCVRIMSPSVIQIDRLFQQSTDTSQRKCCQQISFLWQSILFPCAQLIDPGQVTPSPLCSQSMASSFFSGLIRFPSAAVYFLYDLSPITVTIKEERRNFLHFITRLCAVLGGTFAMTGLLLAYKIVFLSYAAVRIGFNKKKVVYGIPSCMQGLHIKKNKQKYWLMCSIMFHLHQTDTHFSASCVGMLDRWMYRIIESVSSSKPRSGMR
jgi:hypothetical protein